MRLMNCSCCCTRKNAVAVVVLPSSSPASGPGFVLPAIAAVLPVPFSVLFLALVPFFQSHFFL